MGNCKKNKQAEKVRRLQTRTIAIVAILVVCMVLVPQNLGESENVNEDIADDSITQVEADADENTTDKPDEEKSIDAVKFPFTLENGELEIENIIQYEGLNPDCNNQEGSNVAAIILKNVSDTYLESAEISITEGASNVLTFVVNDLPAGKIAIVFSKENESVEGDSIYSKIFCDAKFNADANMSENQISFSVDGTLITLQNNTDQELSDIVIYCHSILGDQYFGGISYIYNIQTIPANGSTEVEAEDCSLGLTDVVRITNSEF